MNGILASTIFVVNVTQLSEDYCTSYDVIWHTVGTFIVLVWKILKLRGQGLETGRLS